jgi:hypothetical protein
VIRVRVGVMVWVTFSYPSLLLILFFLASFQLLYLPLPSPYLISFFLSLFKVLKVLADVEVIELVDIQALIEMVRHSKNASHWLKQICKASLSTNQLIYSKRLAKHRSNILLMFVEVYIADGYIDMAGLLLREKMADRAYNNCPKLVAYNAIIVVLKAIAFVSERAKENGEFVRVGRMKGSLDDVIIDPLSFYHTVVALHSIKKRSQGSDGESEEGSEGVSEEESGEEGKDSEEGDNEGSEDETEESEIGSEMKIREGDKKGIKEESEGSEEESGESDEGEVESEKGVETKVEKTIEKGSEGSEDESEEGEMEVEKRTENEFEEGHDEKGESKVNSDEKIKYGSGEGSEEGSGDSEAETEESEKNAEESEEMSEVSEESEEGSGEESEEENEEEEGSDGDKEETTQEVKEAAKKSKKKLQDDHYVADQKKRLLSDLRLSLANAIKGNNDAFDLHGLYVSYLQVLFLSL